jgi:histidyl-tRNA synthetase
MTSQYEPVRRLPNMLDFGPSELAARDWAQEKLRYVFGLRGYDRAETPILEQTELYIRKSGGGLSSRLYDFSEPGGFEVSLRPEFTSAILRRAADNGASDAPVRLMYDGPVFRYADSGDEDGDKTRQFTQLGAELIGPPAPSADGEIIAMALEGLEALGINGARIVVGHVGVVLAALTEFNLSERAKLFLISNIAELKNGQIDEVSEQAVALGFITDVKIDDAQVAVERERLAATIEQVLAEGIGVQLGRNTGSRTPEEIIARLTRKMSQADNPEDFKLALEMLSKLAKINGPTSDALAAGRKVLQETGITADLITGLDEVLSAALVEGVPADRMSVDFGMARGIAYYTGVLFDIYEDETTSETLGGGGRYDGLTRALGYDRDVPALGFAFNLDAVISSMGNTPVSGEDLTMVSPTESGSVIAAIEKARELRASGKRAAVDFQNSGSLSSNNETEGQGE